MLVLVTILILIFGTGIIHLAGSVGVQAQLLCENPMQYPLFLPAVLPLYLSMVSSFMHHVHDTFHYLWNNTTHSIHNSRSISTGSISNESSYYNVHWKNISSPSSSWSLPPSGWDIPVALTSTINHKILFSNSCNEAVDMVSQELKNRSISTLFRFSKGLLAWPPPPYKIIESSV